MKCPRCRTRDQVIISMQVGGEPVSLHSCSACDVRWWQRGHGRADLADLLALVAAG